MTSKRKDVAEVVPERTRQLTPFDQMDRLFDTLFHRGWLRPFHEMWPEWAPFGEPFEFRTPRVDVIDREDEFLVRAELPGVKKKDLQVDLSGQTLTLRAERRHEEKAREGEVYRAEIAQGTFSRSVQLPEAVNGEGAKADFHDGMLEIHLPKAHKSEKRRIEVQ